MIPEEFKAALQGMIAAMVADKATDDTEYRATVAHTYDIITDTTIVRVSITKCIKEQQGLRPVKTETVTTRFHLKELTPEHVDRMKPGVNLALWKLMVQP